MEFTAEGFELPDDTPVEVPLHFQRPPSMQELIKRYVRTEMSRMAVEQGEESFEEADDFNVDDEDALPFSVHELTPAQEEFVLPRDASNLEAPERRQEAPVPPAAPTQPAEPQVEPKA